MLFYLFIFILPFHSDPRFGYVIIQNSFLVLTPLKLFGLVTLIVAFLSKRTLPGAQRTVNPLPFLLIPFSILPSLSTVLSGLPVPPNFVSQAMTAILLYVTMGLVVIDRGRFTMVVRCVVTGFTFGALWVYKQYFLQHYKQAFGLEGEPNYEALMLLPAVALSFWMGGWETSLRWRRIGWSCAILLVGALILTKSRAGIGAMILEGSVAVLRGRKRTLGFALLTAATLLLLTFGPTDLKERFSNIKFSGAARNGDEASTRIHVELSRAAMRMTLAHPFFGVGVGRFSELAPQYNPELRTLTNFGYIAHNTFLQMSAESGLPILAAFLAMILLSRSRLRKVETADDGQLAALGVSLEAALSAVAFAACFITVELLPFWLLVYLSFRLFDITRAETVASSLAKRSLSASRVFQLRGVSA